MLKKVKKKMNKSKKRKITTIENWNLYKKLNGHPRIKNILEELRWIGWIRNWVYLRVDKQKD